MNRSLVRALAVATLTSMSGFAIYAQMQPVSPPPVSAQSTSPMVTGTNAPLGRLFYSPAQRAALDEMRKRPRSAAAASPEQSSPLPPPPEYVTLNGIVRRSDGTTTVWLNDKQVRGRESAEGLVIAPAKRTTVPNHVTVRVPQTGAVVELKVGQQLEVHSGAVKESYRSPPRQSAVKDAAAAPRTPAPEAPTRDRRSAREREILRDLLQEIDRPAAAAEARGGSSPKP